MNPWVPPPHLVNSENQGFRVEGLVSFLAFLHTRWRSAGEQGEGGARVRARAPRIVPEIVPRIVPTFSCKNNVNLQVKRNCAKNCAGNCAKNCALRACVRACVLHPHLARA